MKIKKIKYDNIPIMQRQNIYKLNEVKNSKDFEKGANALLEINFTFWTVEVLNNNANNFIVRII